MKYQLLHNLGTDDATRCNKEFGAKIDLANRDNLVAGAEIDLTDAAVAFLQNVKGYRGLLAPAGKVKGVDKSPEVKGA
jgi:hypothetical protein